MIAFCFAKVCLGLNAKISWGRLFSCLGYAIHVSLTSFSVKQFGVSPHSSLIRAIVDINEDYIELY